MHQPSAEQIIEPETEYREQQTEIESADTTWEVLDLLEDEIGMYTEPLEANTDETTSLPHDVAAALDGADTNDETDEVEPECIGLREKRLEATCATE